MQTGAVGETATLAVGFPADGRYVRLTVDGRDHVVSETVVDAKHVTRLTFVYADTHDG